MHIKALHGKHSKDARKPEAPEVSVRDAPVPDTVLLAAQRRRDSVQVVDTAVQTHFHWRHTARVMQRALVTIIVECLLYNLPAR